MNSEKATEMYRSAWFQFIGSRSFKEKKALKLKMNSIQPYIEGWEYFKKTLPGHEMHYSISTYMTRFCERQ